MTFQAECTLTGLTGNAGTALEENNNPSFRMFLGWKNANECLRQLEVENMNIDTNYLQTECAKEGFAYSTYMPREEKRNKKYTHSPWDQVNNNIPGICGCYFGGNIFFKEDMAYNDLTSDLDNVTMAQWYGLSSGGTLSGTFTPGNNSTFTISNINVVLPITDLLAFQCFSDFPTGLGDIVLKFFVNKDSMVWAICDPAAVWENHTLLTREFNTTDESAPEVMPSDHFYGYAQYNNHRFTQVGQDGYGITWDTSKTTERLNTSTIRLTVNTLTCTKCQCECFGYNVTQECKRQLVSLFTPQNPFIIPAQQIDVKYFANSAQTSGSYASDFTYALHNVTDFLIVFPRNSADMTVFTNPTVQNLQLRVDGKLYPNQAFETSYDHRFVNAQINAADFTGYFEAEKEYLDSMKQLKHTTTANSRFNSDGTSFICIFQAERNSEGFFFDGLETGNQNVNVQLQFQGSEVTAGVHAAAPQCWFCRDTYWTVDNENGLRYWKTGTPATYASAEDATVA